MRTTDHIIPISSNNFQKHFLQVECKSINLDVLIYKVKYEMHVRMLFSQKASFQPFSKETEEWFLIQRCWVGVMEAAVLLLTMLLTLDLLCGTF